eukprot:scaffold4038_cov181-Pinguiococcus_pyrenoidosus.AAC.2
MHAPVACRPSQNACSNGPRPCVSCLSICCSSFFRLSTSDCATPITTWSGGGTNLQGSRLNTGGFETPLEVETLFATMPFQLPMCPHKGGIGLKAVDDIADQGGELHPMRPK